MYNVTCTPKVITSYLLSVIGILLTANFFVIHRRLVAPYPVLKGFRGAFYFGAEANFPDLFTALLILAVAVMLWQSANVIQNVERSFQLRFLSGFFLLLAVDDFFNLHKQVAEVMYPIFQSELKQFNWMNYLIASLFVLLFAISLIRTIRFFRGRLKLTFLVTCFIYLLGAAIKSLLSRPETMTPDLTDVFISLGQTAGQLLEMISMLLLLHELLHYYLSKIERADIRFTFFPSNDEVLKNDQLETSR